MSNEKQVYHFQEALNPVAIMGYTIYIWRISKELATKVASNPSTSTQEDKMVS